jgi:hypothetical protein
MSLIEERLQFQQLEPSGRLNGIRPQQPLPPRPGDRFIRPSPARRQRGDKGYQQWQDYERQHARPTYLGSNNPNAQLTVTLTNQLTSLLPYAPRRAPVLNHSPRPPTENVRRQPNPLYCSPRESQIAAKGHATRAVIPRLQYNTITGDPASMGEPGALSSASVTRQQMLRAQGWSMFTPANPSGGAMSSNGYGKAGMRPPGGGSQAVGLISGSNNMNIGFTGQSERDFNKRSERMKKWRNGELGGASNRQLTGMQSTGMMSIMGLPNRQTGQLPPMAHARRVCKPALCSPRTRMNGGINPVTGRAYDSQVERNRQQAEQNMRQRQLVRDTTGEKTREDVGGILTGRSGMAPNWLPSTKRVTHVQRTQFPPSAERTSHFTKSKRVYAQANRTSDWSNGPAVTPRSGSEHKPRDTGGGVIFGAKKSNVMGPRGGHFNATKEGAARPGFFANNGSNMSRF